VEWIPMQTVNGEKDISKVRNIARPVLYISSQKILDVNVAIRF